MTTYRKKPIKVQAEKWEPANRPAIVDLLEKSQGDFFFQGGDLYVITVDGNQVRVPRGAYVVLDAKGWPYPCDGEIFELTHEPALVTAEDLL